jgi:hypothetical protein
MEETIMPEIMYSKSRLQQIYEKMNDESPGLTDLPSIIGRIKQKPPEKYGLMDKIDDALYKRGVGSGSQHTRVLKDQADARAKLMKYVQNKGNIMSFQNLPANQKAGIISMIKGEI